MTPTCNSCGAEIRWVRMSKSNRSMPLDIKSEKRVVIRSTIPRGDGYTTIAEVVDTYLSHFATCPNAKKHRSKPDAK